MYHNITELLKKLEVINSKADELTRLVKYSGSHKSVKLNYDRLDASQKYLIDDIQALCREVANDTRSTEDTCATKG